MSQSCAGERNLCSSTHILGIRVSAWQCQSAAFDPWILFQGFSSQRLLSFAETKMYLTLLIMLKRNKKPLAQLWLKKKNHLTYNCEDVITFNSKSQNINDMMIRLIWSQWPILGNQGRKAQGKEATVFSYLQQGQGQEESLRGKARSNLYLEARDVQTTAGPHAFMVEQHILRFHFT